MEKTSSAPLVEAERAADFAYERGYERCAWCSGKQAGPSRPIQHHEACPIHQAEMGN